MSEVFSVTVSSDSNGLLTLALAGNVRAESLAEIDQRIQESEQHRTRVVLNLGDVALMDRDAVRYFARQLQRGIELVNCPAYLKHWISREIIHEPQQ